MIGKFIQTLIDQGYTQVQLAQCLHTTQAQISRYLKDIDTPSVKKLVYIADTFQVTTDKVLGREP